MTEMYTLYHLSNQISALSLVPIYGGVDFHVMLTLVFHVDWGVHWFKT